MGGLIKQTKTNQVNKQSTTQPRSWFGGLSKPKLEPKKLTAFERMIIQAQEQRKAEEAEQARVRQQLEEVRQQREATKAQAEQARIESEAKKTALMNQQRAMEQTGAVDDTGGGGTAKPYNPTSSSSTTVEGLGGERDTRRKRNQLTAYLGI